MDEPVCQGCRELTKQVAELRALVEELTRKLEATQRAGKRQAAPFSKGPPKLEPKPNGRKAGDQHGRHAHRATPERIDEVHEAPLPPTCDNCRGTLIEDDVVEQFQTDIPRQPIIRKFRIHRGHCACCGHKTQGRHPLQTSEAIGAAASQIGPEAQAAATVMHTKFGLSYGKVSALFLMLFGITLSRGAGARINLRAATRLEGDYDEILKDVRGSPQIAADETGWRIGGKSAWLHVWVGERSTAYAIDPHRSADALERVIGLDWSGVLSHDGYATYDRFTEAVHQSCLAHVLRRAKGLLDDATGMAKRFPAQVIDLVGEAIHRRNEHLAGRLVLSDDERERFDERLRALLGRPRGVPEQAKLSNHLWNHFEQWFGFLFDPAIEPTNWRAEQAIRPAVVNRKVWGGNRTAAGAKAQGILMSVFETVQRGVRPGLDYVSESLKAFGNPALPKPVLLLTR